MMVSIALKLSLRIQGKKGRNLSLQDSPEDNREVPDMVVRLQERLSHYLGVDGTLLPLLCGGFYDVRLHPALIKQMHLMYTGELYYPQCLCFFIIKLFILQYIFLS